MNIVSSYSQHTSKGWLLMQSTKGWIRERNIGIQFCSIPLTLPKKYLGRDDISYDLSSFSAKAIPHSCEKIPIYEGNKSSSGIEFLHKMEEDGINANYETYLWLLEACLKYGSLAETMKLHCRILKLGFDRVEALREILMDNYLAFGELECGFKVFNGISGRTIFLWNKLINAFVIKNSTGRVFGLLRQMVAENMNLNETTFSRVLKACGSGEVSFEYVRQIHSSIICNGYGRSSLVCNPLIDLYSKHGYIESARRVFDRLHIKDSISWVAMISGLSQNGLEEEAIVLFCQMHKLSNFPTPYVLSSVISACTKIELLNLGAPIHGLIMKWGFASETYVCNALVTLYSRLGNLVAAEQVFSNMSFKDAVSYNSLICGLAQHGLSCRALLLFQKMHLDCLRPDCVTIASLLGACASVGALHEGQQLQAHAIKAGMAADIMLEGSLLDFYLKCADLETAHDFFLTTNTENIVLWNMMLVAYGQLNDLGNSVELYKQMQIERMTPSQFTYPSILRTCTSLGALDVGQQIHTHIIKSGFHMNAYVSSVLIDMYAKHGKLDLALAILGRLPEEDIVSWTAMMAGYVQNDMFTEALQLFREIQNKGIFFDNIGLSSAITACAGSQALMQGAQVHAQSYVSGFSGDLSINNALISLYARCGRLREAYLQFETTEGKNNVSWNTLISGFAQSGHCEEALGMFAQMIRSEVEVNAFTYGSALSAAANIASIRQGQQIHTMILKTGYAAEIEASNALVTLYAKCGIIHDAKRQFDEISEKNEVSWNAIINGNSQHGYGTEALNLFEEMKQCHVKPNHVTFVGVLSACSHVGLVDEGLGFFRTMQEVHGLVPRSEHYLCMVDLLCRAGLLSRAKDIIEEMPMEPDAMIWRTLLSGCIIHKNTEMGEFAAHHLLELEPDDSATYVLLSNMYATAGKWDGRDQARKLMKERGVKKEPGRSWMEVKNTVHAFYVGDRLHPLADQIHESLGDLNRKVSEIGYVQDTSSLLNDVEQGQKGARGGFHSEKLAIAFGLLTLSKGVPLRVMKNLRVCNDCHNWIKYVSKVSNRTITVRDSHRFHHFEGGLCSCRDYW